MKLQAEHQDIPAPKEVRLVLCIIERAIRDATIEVNRVSCTRKDQEEARQWLTSTSEEEGSLLYYLDMLGLDTAWILKCIREQLEDYSDGVQRRQHRTAQ